MFVHYKISIIHLKPALTPSCMIQYREFRIKIPNFNHFLKMLGGGGGGVPPHMPMNNVFHTRSVLCVPSLGMYSMTFSIDIHLVHFASSSVAMFQFKFAQFCSVLEERVMSRMLFLCQQLILQ